MMPLEDEERGITRCLLYGRAEEIETGRQMMGCRRSWEHEKKKSQLPLWFSLTVVGQRDEEAKIRRHRRM
jgi:hypothetical protein